MKRLLTALICVCLICCMALNSFAAGAPNFEDSEYYEQLYLGQKNGEVYIGPLKTSTASSGFLSILDSLEKETSKVYYICYVNGYIHFLQINVPIKSISTSNNYLRIDTSPYYFSFYLAAYNIQLGRFEGNASKRTLNTTYGSVGKDFSSGNLLYTNSELLRSRWNGRTYNSISSLYGQIQLVDDAGIFYDFDKIDELFKPDPYIPYDPLIFEDFSKNYINSLSVILPVALFILAVLLGFRLIPIIIRRFKK